MNSIDYSGLKELLKAYKNKFSNQFSSLQKDLFDEFVNKLNDLDDTNQEILEIINDLTPKNTIVPGGNGTDIVNIGPFTITLNRADPNMPIQFDNSTVAYPRNEKGTFPEKLTNKERKLERLSFEYYLTADRISHITEKLPDLKSFKCDKIRIVRNHLLEHPEGKHSRITYDTFAYSTNDGPYIKGLRIGNHTQFMDDGFKINSMDFISNLTKTIQKSLNQ